MGEQMLDVMPSRRRARRIQLKFPVWFRSQHRPDELLVGMTENVSASGMVFLTDELLEMSARLLLIFETMPGDRQHRRLAGVVTRTEIDEDS